MKNEKKLQWFTESTYIDIATGEIITRKLAKSKQYQIVNKQRKTQINDTIGIITITNECRKTGQLKLEF